VLLLSQVNHVLKIAELFETSNIITLYAKAAFYGLAHGALK
jgi:hypothetical protein